MVCDNQIATHRYSAQADSIARNGVCTKAHCNGSFVNLSIFQSRGEIVWARFKDEIISVFDHLCVQPDHKLPVQ